MKVWREYVGLFRGMRWALVQSVLLALLQVAFLVPVALLVRRILNRSIPGGDWQELLAFAALILGLYAGDSAISLFNRYVTLAITKGVIERLRSRLLYCLYTLPRSNYAEADHAALHTNIVQDTERLDVMTNAIITHLVPSLIIGTALVGFLILLDWQLGLICLAALPGLLLLGRAMGRRLRGKVSTFHRDFEAFSEGVMFALKTMDLSRVHAAEDQQLHRHGHQVRRLRVSSATMAWFQSAYSLAQGTIITVAGLFVLVVGGIQVIRGAMDLGGLVSFYTVLAFLKIHAGNVLRAVPQIISGHESLLALSSWETRSPGPTHTGKRPVSLAAGLRVEGVTFGYRATPVLRDVSLEIQLGRPVLLTGPSGQGKSTLVLLLLGLYQPQSGRILADGVPYPEIDLAHLRRQVGVVMQDPVIFNGTVAENIAYGCPDASQERIEEVARMVCALDFIDALPHGFATEVGERGALLSGGQRQRLALARAWLATPTLLILDEPTNHMPFPLAKRILENLSTGDSATTLFIVSHEERLAELVGLRYHLEDGSLRRSAPARSLGSSTA